MSSMADDNDQEAAMTPDSSQDINNQTREIRVKPNRVMFKSPIKLKSFRPRPDLVDILGHNMTDDNIFGGHVNGKLKDPSNKYNDIANSFDLYEHSSLPDDPSYYCNKVSSMNDGSKSDLSFKDEDKKSSALHQVIVNLNLRKRSRSIGLEETVTSSDDTKTSNPPVPLPPNGVRKSILKKRSLYVKLNKLSQKEIDELMILNNMPRQNLPSPFPNFFVKMRDYRPFKQNAVDNTKEKSDISINSWRIPKEHNELLNEGRFSFLIKLVLSAS